MKKERVICDGRVTPHTLVAAGPKDGE